MCRKSLALGITLVLALGIVSMPAVGLAPTNRGQQAGPLVAGRVAAVDAAAQTLTIRRAGGTLTVAVDSDTIIVGLDEAYPSREGTVIALAEIMPGDWATAIGRWQANGSLLTSTLAVNHKDYRINGRVRSIDATECTFVLDWMGWRHRRYRATIKYTPETRVYLRGRMVDITRMRVGSLVHVAAYRATGGLVAKQIRILWARRVGHARRGR